jgi:hypothetical protein
MPQPSSKCGTHRVSPGECEGRMCGRELLKVHGHCDGNYRGVDDWRIGRYAVTAHADGVCQ